MFTSTKRRCGFSLLELVIVVVILGIIGAIAIPRLSRGAAGAADSALTSNLAVLRNAIDLYAAEHNNTFPTLADFEDQMLQYSDINGNTQATSDATHVYGPYLRAIPPLPVGTESGSTAVDSAIGAGTGWVYDETTGEISAALAATETDASGTPYADY
jgi:prepilin-type N-terminal cleavage/methylation domain-containing protein